MTRDKSLFLFNDQVKDNMFLSLVPAMLVATAWESLGWWAYANGVAPQWSFDDNPVWFVVLFDLGDFHHQLHHRFIECNYGGLESPLDELIGSLHDGTPDGDQMVTERLNRLSARR